jgi:hypothetical protein
VRHRGGGVGLALDGRNRCCGRFGSEGAGAARRVGVGAGAGVSGRWGLAARDRGAVGDRPQDGAAACLVPMSRRATASDAPTRTCASSAASRGGSPSFHRGLRAQPRAPLDTVKTWMKGSRCETGPEYAEFVAVVEAGRCASLSEADAVRFLSAVRVMGRCRLRRVAAAVGEAAPRPPGGPAEAERSALGEMSARRSLSSWRSDRVPGARLGEWPRYSSTVVRHSGHHARPRCADPDGRS